MNFLNPFFLFGLLAVAVPVVIHLINLRRPQKVSFSTLAFFNELRKSTIRRIRIKKYLLLALRTLALLFLALALARPFLPPTLTGTTSSMQSKAITLLIDNSASMNRVGSKGPLIDQAKELATRIIQNAGPDDKFYITKTNGENVSQSRLLGAVQVSDHLREIEVHNSGHYSKERFASAYQRLQKTPFEQGVIYVITDGQKSQWKELSELNIQQDNKEAEKSILVQPIYLEKGNQKNLAITSIALNTQMISNDAPITLQVKVENVGDAAAVNQFVSLEVEGELLGQYEVGLKPGEAKEYLFKLLPESRGDLAGRIILEGDDIDYDNYRNFVLRIPQKRSILLVGKPDEKSSYQSYFSSALEAASRANAQIEFTEIALSDLESTTLLNYDAIVFDGVHQIPEYQFRDLQRYVQQGNGVLFFPSEQGDVTNYNQFLSLFNAGEIKNVVGEYGSFEQVNTLAKIEAGHPVLENMFSRKDDEEINVDQPALYYYFKYQNAANTGALNILEAANGDPLLAEQQFGEGVVLVSAVGTDPGWSNFPVKPLFAPLYYRSLLYASSTEVAGFQQHTLGNVFNWQSTAKPSAVRLILNESEYKPEVRQQAKGVRISYNGTEWTPGILEVKNGQEVYKVAVNQNILESRFGSLENTEWKESVGGFVTTNEPIHASDWSEEELKNKLSATMFGQEIWYWFIWFAMLFLIMETVVSRSYKAESIS